mmetsp:Transcript_98054/g.168946  ORF Transcript_98054/g.168946 Transcript_98054/m.168946 type:complete len:80 (-) Transcript_98054:116-355(-)
MLAYFQAVLSCFGTILSQKCMEQPKMQRNMPHQQTAWQNNGDVTEKDTPIDHKLAPKKEGKSVQGLFLLFISVLVASLD